MAETKYGKHIIKDPYKKFHQTDGFNVGSDVLGVDCIIGSQGIHEPLYMVKEPHKHSFHQILCFIGGDPTNIHDFGAEIELSLGEEQEKHIITTNTAVSIPPGLPHCPLNFKRVDKPIVFLEFMLTPQYVRETLNK